MRPMFFRLLLGSFAITVLAACTGGESNVVSGNRDGIFHYGNGSEPQGLDPHVVTGVPENHILRALFEGLAVKNPYTLEPEPGVAESWISLMTARWLPSTSTRRQNGPTVKRLPPATMSGPGNVR